MQRTAPNPRYSAARTDSSSLAVSVAPFARLSGGISGWRQLAVRFAGKFAPARGWAKDEAGPGWRRVRLGFSLFEDGRAVPRAGGRGEHAFRHTTNPVCPQPLLQCCITPTPSSLSPAQRTHSWGAPDGTRQKALPGRRGWTPAKAETKFALAPKARKRSSYVVDLAR